MRVGGRDFSIEVKSRYHRSKIGTELIRLGDNGEPIERYPNGLATNLSHKQPEGGGQVHADEEGETSLPDRYIK